MSENEKGLVKGAVASDGREEWKKLVLLTGRNPEVLVTVDEWWNVLPAVLKVNHGQPHENAYQVIGAGFTFEAAVNDALRKVTVGADLEGDGYLRIGRRSVRWDPVLGYYNVSPRKPKPEPGLAVEEEAKADGDGEEQA